MSGTSNPAGDWPKARSMWEAGESTTIIANTTGVIPSTLRNKARREQWQRNTADLEAAAEERRRRTESAKLEASRKWSNRRSAEADAAGITAARARRAIVDAIEVTDDKMTRAAAIAYGVLIDKAQLLSGDATARVDGVDPKERATLILDELAARRTGTG